MSPRPVTLAVVLLAIAASIGVGAAVPVSDTQTPTTPTGANASAAPVGASISMMMQANAAQVEGTVENGMWVAAFATGSNASAKRALVEHRVGQLNGTIAELQAERQALREAYENGTISQTTYRVRLSAIVGRLAALDEGIEETADRGAAVGVNRTRLDQLRTSARELGGGEVSEIARNLTGEPGPPEWAGGPGDGPSGEGGSDRAKNATGPPTQTGTAGDAGNTTRTEAGSTGDGDGSDGSRGQGPPDDRGSEEDESTTTPTEG